MLRCLLLFLRKDIMSDYVTRQDLAGTGQCTAALLAESEQRFAARLAQCEEHIINRVAELLRDAQTDILRSFAEFQKDCTVQMRRMRADQRNLDTKVTQRIAIVENRLAEIEQRLGIQILPPQP